MVYLHLKNQDEKNLPAPSAAMPAGGSLQTQPTPALGVGTTAHPPACAGHPPPQEEGVG